MNLKQYAKAEKRKDAKRDKLIKRVMNDIENNYEHYQEFILDCVKDRVENWEDDELLDWLGD